MMNFWKQILVTIVVLSVVLPAMYSNINTAAEISCVEECQKHTTLPDVVDKIWVKQNDTLKTVVQIQTLFGMGSGIIISQAETEEAGISEYNILTNAHVTNNRLIDRIKEVDSLTGKITEETVDTGCTVLSFDLDEQDWSEYTAKVLFEDLDLDLAIVSFTSSERLNVALIADEQQLEQVQVFDEIIAVGCQLGQFPTPTTGIISQILTGENGEKQWKIYQNTSNISPGSSGGGLFKKYGDRYFLIGVPFSVTLAHNGQIMTHLAYAISITTAREYINQTLK